MTRYIQPFMMIIAVILSGCLDDFKYENIGEGEASVTATVNFHPLISAPVMNEESRTDGDEIRTIRNIQVVIYNANGEIFRIDRYGEGYEKTFTSGSQSGMPDDLTGVDKSESSTQTASFTIENLPFGRYKMYVVANYRRLDEEEDGVQSPERLKSLKAYWSEKNVKDNDQMFGFFATDNQSEHEDAPVIVVNKTSVNLIAWIKRLASKLTIVYNGEDLWEGINIYIKSVTVRDIPKSCVLGFDKSQLTKEQIEDNVNGNCPTSQDSLIDIPAHGSLYYQTVYQSNLDNEIDEVITSDEDPDIEDYHDWLHITKSTRALGAVSVKDDHTYELGEDGKLVTHTETMQSLFFYENCQGNYPDQKDYDKTPFTEDVGKDEKTPGIYKDKVPCGTYIEVEGYYVSSNPDNQSSGPIKYRFMLGQNATYNYNALRNRHYKIFLKFRGYGNQPEWHIVYEEKEPGLYPNPEYRVSYMYNIRHNMPIRLTGQPYRVTLQIIENNWAPYDPTQPDSVAPDRVGSGNNNFRWYRDLYHQINRPFVNENGDTIKNAEGDPITGSAYADDYSPQPKTSYGLSGYYYGLHALEDYNSIVKYDPGLPYSLPKYRSTPIWAGFLALQVPSWYNDTTSILPTGINDTQGTDNYSEPATIQGMWEYYTGQGGVDTDTHSGDIPLYQCTYDFENNLPANPGVTVKLGSVKSPSTTGRNAATLKNNGDESYTLTVPLFTMPKSIGYITGFSGNNPYEAYQRRAKILITAYYKIGDQKGILRSIVPVFQQKRVVNPKGVWRTGDSQESFEVKLMDLNSPNDTYFHQIESEDGDWSAWVATPKNEQKPDMSSFVKLEGWDSDGKVKGSTGSKINFTINFDGTTSGSRCAKVIVKYHGNNCEHAIFVRQGYNVPLAIVENGAQWSSFSVYAFNGEDLENATSNLPSADQDMLAEMTVNPLALGTMYKRGNYGQGIRIINNKKWEVMVPIDGQLELIKIDDTGTHDNSGKAYWSDILGIRTNTLNTREWEWSTFHSSIVTSSQNYNYDLPRYEDYTELAKQDFGIGVVYANGAGTTALTTTEAYSYFNDGNTTEMQTNSSGMRGIIVYNKNNFNQIFFPIGYSGVGRRTVQILPPSETTPNIYQGYLRYGATWYRLSTGATPANQYRPVAYNLPANPGALYWMKKAKLQDETTYLAAWDINYFDLAFSAYDASTNDPNGDAIPIKPIIRGTGYTPPNP